jgi:hypothetical protein
MRHAHGSHAPQIHGLSRQARPRHNSPQRAMRRSPRSASPAASSPKPLDLQYAHAAGHAIGLCVVSSSQLLQGISISRASRSRFQPSSLVSAVCYAYEGWPPALGVCLPQADCFSVHFQPALQSLIS